MWNRKLAGKKGFSLVHLMVAISICIVLAGITTYGIAWARRQAEITATTGKVNNIAQALQLHYQQKGYYPEDCPAQLQVDLQNLVADLDLSSISDIVNAAYCRPMKNDPNSYMFSLVPTNTKTHTVAAFGDGYVDIGRTTEILWDGNPIERGAVVTTGRIEFATGSSVVPFYSAPITIVAGFMTSDDTPYEVVKIAAEGTHLIDIMSANKSVCSLSTINAVTLARDGGARVYSAYTETEKVQVVGAVYGEIIVSFPPFSKGELGSVDAGTLGGEPLEMSPGGEEDFSFYLRKPDGTEITRDDLLADRSLEYIGPASVVRFRLNSGGGQNESSLVLNGVEYPIEKNKIYTIAGSDLTLRLFNDKVGKGMGLWRIDNIAATNAIIYEGVEEPEGSVVAGYTLGAVILIKEPVIGKMVRTLGKTGYRVMPGTFVYSSADAE